MTVERISLFVNLSNPGYNLRATARLRIPTLLSLEKELRKILGQILKWRFL